MKIREFSFEERAHIVSLARTCTKKLSSQPLIDYFNKFYRTRFENNGTVIADTIINKYYPDCNDTMRNNLHEIMLQFAFDFECMIPEGDDIPLLTATIEKTENVYTGSINEVAGCVAQGNSTNEVKDDLLKIYWIKRAVEDKIEKNDKRESNENS